MGVQEKAALLQAWKEDHERLSHLIKQANSRSQPSTPRGGDHDGSHTMFEAPSFPTQSVANAHPVRSPKGVGNEKQMAHNPQPQHYQPQPSTNPQQVDRDDHPHIRPTDSQPQPKLRAKSSSPSVGPAPLFSPPPPALNRKIEFSAQLEVPPSAPLTPRDSSNNTFPNDPLQIQQNIQNFRTEESPPANEYSHTMSLASQGKPPSSPHAHSAVSPAKKAREASQRKVANVGVDMPPPPALGDLNP